MPKPETDSQDAAPLKKGDVVWAARLESGWRDRLVVGCSPTTVEAVFGGKRRAGIVKVAQRLSVLDYAIEVHPSRLHRTRRAAIEGLAVEKRETLRRETERLAVIEAALAAEPQP